MSAHADWLSLVLCSGLVVSEPLLDERWPHGPTFVPRGTHLWFRRKYEHYTVARSEGRADGVRRWVDFMLEGMLDLPAEHWLKASQVPDDCRVFLEAFQQEISADRVLRTESGNKKGKGAKSHLLVLIFPPGQHLDRPDRTPGRWKASPTTKLDRLLRETGHELGLVTNGESFRLLYAPAGMTGGSITFTAAGFSQEKATLDAFTTLLHRDVLHPSDGQASLAQLCAWSRDRQGEVADQLGIQVREGLEHLLLAWDRADRDSQGALLSAMTEDDIYEMGLVVMMRLVFLLYAEEKGLLPHGEVLYDQAYGLTYMWHRIEEQRRERQSSMGVSHDAWDRLLATARLIHSGSNHPDLALRAHGGRLFDPERYPALESPACTVSNHTLHQVLHRLLFARPRRGAEIQRVGYWALTVEQVGYIYEGLLDHRCARAGGEPMVKLRSGGETAWPLSELENRKRKDLLDWLESRTGRKREVLEVALNEPDDQSMSLLRRYPADMAERFRPFAGVLRCDELAPPGWRYLTTGSSRRDTGTQYTPESLTGPVVEDALAPQVFRCEPGKPGLYLVPRQIRPPRELLALKVCDPAMGSGAFLVQVVRYLSERLVEAWDEAARQHQHATLVLPYAEPTSDAEGEKPIPFDDREAMRLEAARLVAERCVYGVDINPLAVEMGKLSLWLATLSRDKPFTFLDHALKTGDSLLGVDLEQIRTFSLDRKGTTLPLLDRFARWADEALASRRAIHAARPAEGEETKRRLLTEAESAMGRARQVGDLLVGTFLSCNSEKARADLQGRYRALLVDDLKPTALPGSPLTGRHPFHWNIEFPEVFVDQQGFDALLGNPPFMGGKKISGNLGSDYREWLVHEVSGGRKGNADLVAYFFLRAPRLLHPCGTWGFVAVNTLLQGDTRRVGLERLLQGDTRIYRGTTSRAWPGGGANLEIVTVHACVGPWSGTNTIDGTPVSTINAHMDRSETTLHPMRLIANASVAGIGCDIKGLGFLLSTDEARHWIDDDPKNQEVIRPYLNGKELSSHPEQQPSRWAVDFRHWPLDRTASGRWAGSSPKMQRAWLGSGHVPSDYSGPVVRDWKRLSEWLQPRVVAARAQSKTKAVREWPWWRYWRPREDLYRSIRDFRRVVVRARTADRHAIAFVDPMWVLNENVVVFTTPDSGVLAVLQSSVHESWARRFTNTFRTDMQYSPTNCLENFPFPCADPFARIESLEDSGNRYEGHRKGVMRTRWVGLTDTYNLFHNPACTDSDIQTLRDLHVELDHAVRDAYNWDFPLDHGWRKTVNAVEKKNRRTGKKETVEQVSWNFTVSEDARQEILRRLLALNHERYTEEVAQGLHGGPKAAGAKTNTTKRRASKKKTTTAAAKRRARSTAGSQAPLFGGLTDLFGPKKS